MAAMKFSALALSLSAPAVATNLLAVRTHSSLDATSKPKDGSVVHYGDTLCPCIGFDNIEGETLVDFDEDGDVQTVMPAEDPEEEHDHEEDEEEEEKDKNDKKNKEEKKEKEEEEEKEDKGEKEDKHEKDEKDDEDEEKKDKKDKEDNKSKGEKKEEKDKDEKKEKEAEKAEKAEKAKEEKKAKSLVQKRARRGIQVAFPADLGARCEAWDKGKHPKCHGDNQPSWCHQSWCFVDACNCNINILPKLSVYAPDARYRGKPIFYSYATCGGEDTFAKAQPEVGTHGCRCIGFDNIPGSTDVRIGKEVVSYPAEIGGTCRAWDQEVHPLCKNGGEDWCGAKWCYVDPCSCNLAEPPKVTMYLPEATFTGKSLYYSYETCGSKDTFTKKHNTEACVNQMSEQKCEGLKREDGNRKCAWTGSKCLGAELVNHPLCTKVVKSGEKSSAAATAASMLAAVVASAALVQSM